MVTEIIEHMTNEWSLVIAGHVNYNENGAFISELNSVTDCNLRGVVQPEERGERSRRGAGQADGAAEL